MSKEYYTAADYVANPDLFVPVWADKKKVAPQLLDFEEKWEQFFTPNGRVMSDAHRGDNVNYPECSTEAFLSAIMAGADILEVDVHLTKDGIPVVMHDPTVNRMTNVDELRAAGVEGLPKFDRISEWTLEQLRKLRLRASGNSEEVTNYVIPTLEDIILLSNNRCFITLDKFNKYIWREDILPLLKKHHAYRTVMLPYAYTHDYSYARVKEFMDEIQELSGYPSALMSRSVDPTWLEFASTLIQEYGFPMVLRCGEFTPEDYEEYIPYFEKFRIHIECLRAWHDTIDVWQQIVKEGYNLIVTNDICGLTDYIQELYF